MAYTVINYFYKNLQGRLNNALTFEGLRYETIDRQFFVSFEFDIDYDRLCQQSVVFSRDYVALNTDLRKIVSHRQEEWDVRLAEAYIYSYFVSLLLGLQQNNNEYVTDDTYLFKGHSIFSRIISKRRFESTDVNGTNITTSLVPSFKFDEELIDKICVNFPFIQKTMFEERQNGLYTLYSQVHHRVLSALNSNDKNNVSMSKIERDSSSDNQFLLPDSCPIGNSCFIGDSKWGYIYDNSIKDPTYNVSLWLCRALFIKLKAQGDRFETNNIYQEFDKTEAEKYFTKFEVHSITFLKASSTLTKDAVQDIISSYPKHNAKIGRFTSLFDNFREDKGNKWIGYSRKDLTEPEPDSGPPDVIHYTNDGYLPYLMFLPGYLVYCSLVLIHGRPQYVFKQVKNEDESFEFGSTTDDGFTFTDKYKVNYILKDINDEYGILFNNEFKPSYSRFFEDNVDYIFKEFGSFDEINFFYDVDKGLHRTKDNRIVLKLFKDLRVSIPQIHRIMSASVIVLLGYKSPRFLINFIKRTLNIDSKVTVVNYPFSHVWISISVLDINVFKRFSSFGQRFIGRLPSRNSALPPGRNDNVVTSSRK